MGIYGLLLLLLLLVSAGLVFWIVKIIRLFRKGRTRRAVIHAIVLLLLVLFVCWEFRLLPLSAEFKFRKQTEALTGKEFWCWNEYLYEEWGMRGEGFTFEIYSFDKEIANYYYAPPPAFFNDFPRADVGVSRWKKTPLPDSAFLSSMMPVYGNWSGRRQKMMESRYKIVRQIAESKGYYYALRRKSGNDLYLLSPEMRLIIWINYNY